MQLYLIDSLINYIIYIYVNIIKSNYILYKIDKCYSLDLFTIK